MGILNNKIKIGILTFHDGINHGAYLQVYALQNHLKKIGYENEIINYKNFKHWYNEYKCFLYKKSINDLIENIKKILKFKKCHKKLKLTNFNFSHKSVSKKHFDIIIIGSDEIWNFKNPILNFDSIYFGKYLNSNNLISYAASFGAISENEKIPDAIKNNLKKFKAISVRDKNSFNIIKKLIEIKASIVLDPTFLYDYSKEIIECPYENFILLYSGKLNREFIEEIKNYAKKINKKIISIGYKHSWSDINIIALDPFEWIGYFKKSSVVITSMFHGTIFAIKYNKQFSTILTPYRKNKFDPILNDLNLSKRALETAGKLEESFNDKIDYKIVNQKLDILIAKSKDYLDRTLRDY